MKLKKFIQFAIVFMLITGISISTVHVDKAQAATTNKVKVTTYYAGNNKDLKYPKVSGMKNSKSQEKVNQAFINYGRNTIKVHASIMKQKAEDSQEEWCLESSYVCDYTYSTTYKHVYQDASYMSFMLYSQSYMGGAHGMGNVDTYNFNAVTGNRILINNVLNTKAKMAKVQKYVYNYMIKRPDYFINVHKLSDVRINKDTQFIYYKGGIAIVFGEYEVSYYAAGNPIVYVPRSVYK